ncbi:MAG TPA: multifunctional oxoglutarate decarboxylase/oxoglutarate dehydrogenase thiamine pyrophosphate-binding subunit/dihydrolipoyllysine-residue succinyltransferase subunit [Solirubrobacteraceae bacterium]|nr:multifunctional oxoglutarate decarboxylase/oxoglutarate dehydrogenase thiamine pyrophosphate-binding subunit/dihydrolipoyllysine-residue succinyltransferase subunit [Solirubrobacteraceae bacterium]
MAVETGTYQVVMPAMGDSVVEGTVLEWHKQEGDSIEVDETLVEISTDKVDAELPSPVSGTIVKLYATEGDTIGVGAPLAEIAISANGNGNGSGATPVQEPSAEADVIDIVTPAGSESVTEGTILEWSVKVGDAVNDGDTIVEISTDKVDMELPAPAAGTITELLYDEGATVGVGAVIARMSVGAGAAAAAAPAVAPPPQPKRQDATAPASQSAKAATPIAQRAAAALGVNLQGVAGSARGGRVTKDDVLYAAASVVELPVGAQKLKGGGAALARYMDESRSMPTATSFRTLAVTALDARRTQLKGSGLKVSFTHLIAYAIAKAATDEMPVMAHHFVQSGGDPYRVDDGQVNLGLAVDVEKKDGSRTLMVPVIRDAGRLSFREFLDAYNGLVEKARTNTLSADDLTGGNISLTNPGGIGTVASVPRLMVGQGTIVATGSISYPVGLEAIGAQIGAEKVMTMTSTYDHRIIQGAESGRFLKVVEEYLQGEHGFYEAVFSALGASLPALPPRPAVGVGGRTQSAAGGASQSPDAAAPAGAEAASAPSEELLQAVQASTSVLKAYRMHGHLAAKLDPLGIAPAGDPALDPANVGLTPELMAQIPARILRLYVPGATLAEAIPYLKETYCGSIAYEIEHIASHRQRLWLREAIESGTYRKPPSPDEQKQLLARLTAVDSFERFMGRAYLGAKRFSVEGVDMTVPMIDEIIKLSGEGGAREVVVGMAHRGRVNVLAHNLGRSYESLFAEFEGANTLDAITTIPDGGTGDVKYHHGASGSYQLPDGESVVVRLESNPSHLEFVAPVVSGATRAAQTNRQGAHASQDTNAAVPIVLHGDASFPGQGVVAETLNLQALDGYTVGGTIHIIQNNQVGFTTDQEDSRSTNYASDLAKGFDVPIIHVNADNVEACITAVRLGFAFRREFGHDVMIDLIGYRRHGHNEGDEPLYTQPEMYALVKEHEPVRELFAKQMLAAGVISEAEDKEMADAAWALLTDHHNRLKDRLAAAREHVGEHATGEYKLDSGIAREVNTAVDEEKLQILNEELLAVPEGFEINRKLANQLGERRKAFGPEHGGINWAHAEALAFATLLNEGIPLRLTGQDTERGTFSHRHLVLHDSKTGHEHSAIQHLPGAQATMELHNSPLSEMACIGFEYGYSQEAPETLVMWEAQFGDFVNGAQVMIDQFIIAGLAKWGLTSRLTLLLPHGYEGAGPEHSSARLERFLQLAAEGNIRVANLTTPGQYFHLLRRQARIAQQRPLMIMTPKSLLRLPAAASHVEDLTTGRFQPVMSEPGVNPAQVTRLLLCSGKIYYDIIGNPLRAETPSVAIGRVELLYPFPEEEILALIDSYPNLDEVVWVQEEPRNMGGRAHMSPRLQQILPEKLSFGYVGRPERAASGEGYPAAHAREQNRIVVTALDLARPISQYPLANPGDR